MMTTRHETTTLHESASRASRAVRAPRDLGLMAALASAMFFGTSGPFAKALLDQGWSSGAIVLLRVAGAALVLLPATLRALRGRWHLTRENAGVIAAYGGVAVAGCQVSYFYAIGHIDVGVALLLEYLAIILVVLWVWARTRRAPGPLTGLGIALALGGLMLVLNLTGQSRPDLIGVMWGLIAAVGLATFFVVAAHDSALPPVALVGLGMIVGSVVLGFLGLVRLLPMTFSTAPVTLHGTSVPWWAAIGELAVVAAAAAYVLGVTAARKLGSTIASFVGLTEVLFAVLFSWLLLGQLSGLMQLAGGVLILGGVVAVRAGEARRERADVAAVRASQASARAARAVEPEGFGETDFPVLATIA